MDEKNCEKKEDINQLVTKAFSCQHLQHTDLQQSS